MPRKRKKKANNSKRRSKKGSGRTAFLFLLVSIGLLSLGAWYLGPFKKIIKILPPASNEAPERLFTTKPKIVFVIDDIGYHLEHLNVLRDLDDQVTYAILPLLPYSQFFGNLSSKTGAEVILHLPLEAMDGTVPGRGLITRSMPPSYVLDMLNRDLASVPNAAGANNHMGSLGTGDSILMTLILGEMKRRGMFFLDSRTSPKSAVPEIGRQVGIPFLSRDVFLDNIDAKQPIRNQIRLTKSIARTHGQAIAIGHYRANTLEVLKEEIPRLEAEGFEVVSLKELLAFLKWKEKSQKEAVKTGTP